MTIRVAAMEDGSLTMCGAVETLRGNNLFTLLGVYGSFTDLTAQAVGQPVVLLVDPFGDQETGLSDLACVPKPYAALVMSAHTNVDSVRYALRAGARGFISKESCASTLFNAISVVGYGGLYPGSRLDGMLIDGTLRIANPFRAPV